MDPGAQPPVAKVEVLAPGMRVGRYHLLRRLAIGGMAELHLACAEGLAGFQKVVVLKRVLPHLAADADFIRLFVNEARLAANLDHPNLVQVMDIGEADGEYFYVMEHVHGRNAREILGAAAERGGLPLPVALTIVTAAAAGLHHAHERTDLDGNPLGLVHRDVSPSNVLISHDGAIKVTDFGIAKASARSTETIGGTMKGKIGYMAPEQCRGEAVDRRSDVFALGILLYELTTTERLFFGDNDFAVLNRVVQGRFDPPSVRVPDYPPALERIVLRALSLEPDDRYPTAAALLQDVETFVHEEHLRCTPAVVGEWMAEVFGHPPFPRVELRPAEGDDPLETIPTLVPVSHEAPADPSASTRAEAEVSTAVALVPAGETMVATPRRPRWIMALGVSAAVGLGVLGWGLASSRGEVTDRSRASEPAPVVIVPTAAVGAEPSSLAAANEAGETGSTTGASTDEGSGTSGEASSRPSKRTKRRKRSKAKPPRERPDSDPNVLYPVKGR
ncbi:serine/threonine-protein kinase [Paraliomyxa miuraensis]|uniref:serine/threonine-protein kinase n=1 Tax=Paraliomyxa miuraensis TaxID=376150 RepID=UPI002254FAEA|nr:serine/threonine-protein kinase [Paraliomyxa miuraensis]MCX4241191.1 serine/threonine protein kinase [Paraliomyxa miuraensis]